jgi:hypothetical protein
MFGGTHRRVESRHWSARSSENVTNDLRALVTGAAAALHMDRTNPMDKELQVRAASSWSARTWKGGDLIESGAVTYGGKFVVNPSGGLISKGHPLGATGLAQCAELNWQLRGMAEKRQVPGAKAALQHNLGLGGAAVVTMYRKPDVGWHRVRNE